MHQHRNNFVQHTLYEVIRDVSQLTIAEAACLAALPKDPPKYQPINHPEANKSRREYILYQMYDNGAISTDEYENALKEDIKFVGYNKVDENGNKKTNVTSYFFDAAVKQVTQEFMELYGIDDYNTALNKLKSGGYKIYTTMNPDIQSQLEAKYNDPATFSDNKAIKQALIEKYINPSEYPGSQLKDPPQSASIIMDYSGNILGVITSYSIHYTKLYDLLHYTLCKRAYSL